MSGEHDDVPGNVPGNVPDDVVTGFWLWIVALPLMTAGYVVDLITAPDHPGFVTAIAGFSAVVVFAIVLALLVLLRSGYRWARTLLTGGGAASVVYAVGDLFGVDRQGAAALAYAACAIFGSVSIVGGMYLLHRKDTHAFFVR